jgi:predicted transcriptional regulator
MRGATRTQIYLTADQRKRLDEIARRDRRSLAELIRAAVDEYLKDAGPPSKDALEATFGASPHLEVPDRGEWDRD